MLSNFSTMNYDKVWYFWHSDFKTPKYRLILIPLDGKNEKFLFHKYTLDV